MIDIIEDESGFYYFDENDDTVGPFGSWDLASKAAEAASKWEAKDNQEKHTIRKMKSSMEA